MDTLPPASFSDRNTIMVLVRSSATLPTKMQLPWSQKQVTVLGKCDSQFSILLDAEKHNPVPTVSQSFPKEVLIQLVSSPFPSTEILVNFVSSPREPQAFCCDDLSKNAFLKKNI